MSDTVLSQAIEIRSFALDAESALRQIVTWLTGQADPVADNTEAPWQLQSALSEAQGAAMRCGDLARTIGRTLGCPGFELPEVAKVTAHPGVGRPGPVIGATSRWDDQRST